VYFLQHPAYQVKQTLSVTTILKDNYLFLKNKKKEADNMITGSKLKIIKLVFVLRILIMEQKPH
jgi:hypothetical protein